LEHAFYDTYLNEVERDSLAFDGTSVAIFTIYNGQNLVAERDGPCFKTAEICASAGSELYSYDELGRLISVTHGDGSTRTRQYSGLKVSDFDEVQNQRYVVQDQLGRATRSVAFVDNGREIATNFTYEPFGLLHTVADAYGNTVRSVHDASGRQIELSDPDSGDHFYKWSPFDELSEEQDGNGFYIRYVRDALGRVETIRDKDGVTRICWDRVPNGIGNPAFARSTDGIQTDFQYDPVGRVSKATWMIGGKKYNFGTTYDPAGRIDTISYPFPTLAPFTVQRKYNSSGFLWQVVNAKTQSLYWQDDLRTSAAKSLKRNSAMESPRNEPLIFVAG